MVGGRHFSLHWQRKNCFFAIWGLCGSNFFWVTCKQKLAKTDISADWATIWTSEVKLRKRAKRARNLTAWIKLVFVLFLLDLPCFSQSWKWKWLYLKGNYDWRDPFWFSMIMGRSVVSVILLISSNTDLADFFIGVIPFENRLTLRTFAGEIEMVFTGNQFNGLFLVPIKGGR